jgi:GDP-L-fucose synthase
MVGSALVRRLTTEDCEVITAARDKVDLRNQEQTEAFMASERPDAVFLAAARVGGILANDSHPVAFLQENLAIEMNVVRGAYKAGVEKLLFLGSSCIYPRMAKQPIVEEELMTGPLEPTNQWYALAKIAGIWLAQAYRKEFGCDFISAMPSNLYGPGDNFDLFSSHAMPALIRKAHDAKRLHRPALEVWGTGKPMREFLYVDDCADGLVHLMKHYSGDMHVNVGTGKDETIREVAEAVARVVGFTGDLQFDETKPDGTPRKVMDVSRLKALGWQAKTSLEEGIDKTYEWFKGNVVEKLAAE